MASAFDDEFAEFASPELLDDFGEDVYRHPGGDDALASRQTITAIVQQMDPEPHTEHGRELLQKVKLRVADSHEPALDDRDQWTIGGTRFQTIWVALPDGGLIDVMVQAFDIDSRKEGRGNLL